MVLIISLGFISAFGNIMKDDRCLIKTIKTENITDKHNMT